MTIPKFEGKKMQTNYIVFSFSSAVNSLTLVALTRRVRKLEKKSGDIFILNLAAVDLVYCLIALPTDGFTYLTETTWSWSTGAQVFCSASSLIKYVAAFMDWTSLALIGIERRVNIDHT
jgi:hypothetical protein